MLDSTKPYNHIQKLIVVDQQLALLVGILVKKNEKHIKVEKDGSMDRKYLKLSYPESSFMEYPREWEERMMFWDDIMKRA